MSFLRRVLLAALFAGVVSGALAAVLHQFATVPLILEAEKYEQAPGHAAEHAASSAGAANSAPEAVRHDEHAAAWEPETRLERALYTLAADLLAGIGFALLLAAGMTLRGDEIAWREGLFWGLAGFVAFTVAPGLGLPPEIPGTDSGPLLARQFWWVATAGVTASALALLAFTRHKLIAAVAVALLVLPHLYGAPAPGTEPAAAPAALARQFVVTATVASLLFWAALGAMTGYFYDRLGRGAR